jgi:putative colanic acid biosysnthesis UDP-glucose lipid carrier transferase
VSQPVVLKSSVSIALVRLLQGVFAALVAPLVMVVVAGLAGRSLDRSLEVVAVVAAALALVIFQPRRSDGPAIRSDITGLMIELLLRWILTLILLYAIGLALGETGTYRTGLMLAWGVGCAVVTCAGQALLAWAMRRIVQSSQNQRSAVILGVNVGSVLLAHRLDGRPDYCIKVNGFFDDRQRDRLQVTDEFPILGRSAELLDYVRRERIDVIFIALPLKHIERVMILLDGLRDSTASIYYVPDVEASDLIQSRSVEIDGVPLVAMYETPFYGYRGVLKRITDIVFSLGLLVVVSPVLILVALLVKLTSRGPLIFKQRRYGLDGHEILVYKFRSMTVTEDGDQISQAKRDDKRVTAVGRYLRKYSIDELPQIFNVLEGTMSLVGPRPHAVAHNELYRRIIKGYMMRHKVLPGITGLAQVSGCRGETAELEQMQARVNYDLEYLRRWSPGLDLQIIVRTALLLVFGDKKAY